LNNYPDLSPFFSLPVVVENTGNITSDYVALAFVKGQYGPSPYPNKNLAGFTRLHAISPSAVSTVLLDVKLGSIARSDKDGNLVLWPGNYTMMLDIDARDTWEFEITGDRVVLEKIAPSK
jgi:beta-D-xylosidase 4